ncbi:hypothetical protein CDD80_6529 [Ophiocordyceps camponoti-rufipedis]|uniref:Phosphoribosylaminoimidazole-succinocarboxamide synthase n=1 Tax=Ophiocordyceps camponoti-rufipedis TaxID=2004952 RepID=A0A2C5YQY9_9HYPO|nr:hypothetical protein CDD80_6529 [Ophiocordyceps camponoti-rufipedis]
MSFPSFDFDQHLDALHRWLSHSPPPSPSPRPQFPARSASSDILGRADELYLETDSPPPSLDTETPRKAGSSRAPQLPSHPPLPLYRTRNHHAADFDEVKLTMAAASNAARMGVLKDELDVIAGKITPGVDDTPYIQYALEALTREPQSRIEAIVERQNRRFDAHRPPQLVVPERERALAHTTQPPGPVGHLTRDAGLADAGRQRLSEETRSHSSPGAHLQHWIAVDKDVLPTIDPRGTTYPPLTFKPRILRPLSAAALFILCLLMMTAYIFSNRYSQDNLGLTPYPGSIYSGQYFLFRILPPLVAAAILIYSQCILTASRRILPFISMAQEDPRERYLALFQRLYPKSFLLPQLVGPWQLVLFDLATWLAVLTVPLQSAAFTCIYVRDGWIWAPSQGVAWALVGLYGLLGASTAVVAVFWLRQWTGLRWDVRCIADVMTLMSRTNTMHSYARQAVLDPGSDFKTELRDRWFDRLGYWQTGDVLAGGVWHTIGTSAMQGDAGLVRRASYDVSMGSRDFNSPGLGSKRHLPLSLRDGPLLAFVVITGGLLIALLTVCFLPQMRFDAGFEPLLSAGPNQAAFSAANFVYSFVPALLGMVLSQLFQSVDGSLRMVQPWGSMAGPEGTTARRSLLADYSACLPLQSTWRALGNGHWRTAATSLMALLSMAIPVLAGGLFMALTSPDGQVRMFPSMPVLGVLLALLLLYVASLCLLIPGRRQFLLPHEVDSVAAVVSLCSSDDVAGEAAFRTADSRGDVAARLDETVWILSLSSGKDEQRLSVRRLTERARGYKA